MSPSVLYFPVSSSSSGGIRAARQPQLFLWWLPELPRAGGANCFPGSAQTLPEKCASGGPGGQRGKPRAGLHCHARPTWGRGGVEAAGPACDSVPITGSVFPMGPRPLQGGPCACCLRLVLCSVQPELGAFTVSPWKPEVAVSVPDGEGR